MNHTQQQSPEWGPVLDRLSGISSELLSSYEELSRRAQHVEEELGRTNAALADKVSELDATRLYLEAILHAIPTGVVVRDEEGRIDLVNGSGCEILGCSALELVGQIEHPGLQAETPQGETYTFKRPDGEARVLASKTSDIRSSDGNLNGSVEIIDDRTELSELTDRVHRMDKMAALGTMAGGIAHEIRNPMNAIKGFAGLLLRGMPEESRETRWCSLICEGVDEADGIITSMLTFAEPERLRLETVDGEGLVEEAIQAAKRSIPSGKATGLWKIDSSVDAEAFPADRIKLRQALRNLIANAIDIQPDGGSITVDLHREDEHVVLCVRDSGPGIDPELEHRVVDPFFTTRADGTGLGLSLVHTIVKLHGGRFEISNRPDAQQGAQAVIRIPFFTAS